MAAATAAIIGGAVSLAGGALNRNAQNKANKRAIAAEDRRREQTRLDVASDMKPEADFNSRLNELQKEGYMNSTEGKGLSNALMQNQNMQLNKLGDMASLGNFTDEAKLAGIGAINNSTSQGLSSLAQQSTAYRRSLLGMEQQGISNYVGQKYNAIAGQNAITAGNTQALYAQNAQNFQSGMAAASQIGDTLSGLDSSNWFKKKSNVASDGNTPGVKAAANDYFYQ